MSLDRFRKSSFCAGGGCVAAAHTDDAGIALCSTVTPDAGVLAFPGAAKVGFMTAIKAGRLDWPRDLG